MNHEGFFGAMVCLLHQIGIIIHRLSFLRHLKPSASCSSKWLYKVQGGVSHAYAHASTVLHALFTWATLYHFTNFPHRYLLWDWYCCDTNPSGAHWCRFCCDRWLLCCFMTVVILPVGLWQGRGVAILAPHVPHFADYQRCDTLWQTDNPSTSPVIRHGWFPWPPEPVWYGTAHDCQHSQSAPSAPCGVGRTLYWQLPPSRPPCRKGDGPVPALRRMDACSVHSPAGEVQPRQLGMLHLP